MSQVNRHCRPDNAWKQVKLHVNHEDSQKQALLSELEAQNKWCLCVIDTATNVTNDAYSRNLVSQEVLFLTDRQQLWYMRLQVHIHDMTCSLCDRRILDKISNESLNAIVCSATQSFERRLRFWKECMHHVVDVRSHAAWEIEIVRRNWYSALILHYA